MGERLERWLLLLLYGGGSLGSIVALIDPLYLISDYMTSGLVFCAVCLAGVLAEWGCSFAELTVGSISVRVVILFLFFISSLSLKIVWSKFPVLLSFYSFWYAFLVAMSSCVLGGRVSKPELLTDSWKGVERVAFADCVD